MNLSKPLRRVALAAALLTGLVGIGTAANTTANTPANSPAPSATTPMPGASLYQLNTMLTDDSSQRFTLRDMAGTPVLVTMFYGDCHAACPIIIETLKRTVAALGPSAGPLRVVLISLDPQHDSPASLAMLARKHELEPHRFRLAVAADDSTTRTLAAALNVKFRRLDNGEINHTTRVVLLDATGATRAASTRLDVNPDPAFVTQIAALMKTVKTGSDQGIAK